jgi:flagellar FliL protein
MADDKELEVEKGKKGGSKMIIIIVAVVVLLGGGAAAFFMLSGSPEEPMEEMVDDGSVGTGDGEGDLEISSAELGDALYVAMPRPFVFNVPGASRDRLVQIKVQLLVRGPDNEELSKIHIPSIEGSLLKIFSQSNADDLTTEVGKTALRDDALREIQTKMQDLEGQNVVEQVLFTGFVMQ